MRFLRHQSGDPIARLRNDLVDRLVLERLITRPEVEAAFRSVPRHLFLPDLPVEQAYANVALVTKRLDGVAVSSSSQPSIMAIMLEQLDLHPGQRVLEIGAGTGYNAALIARLVTDTGSVVTVDLDADTVEAAEAHLREAGVTGVRVVCGDGGQGFSEGEPYDRIIVTVGAPDVLPAWRRQLVPGGQLVLPLSIRGPQYSVAFRQRDEVLAGDSVVSCGFMRLRGPEAEEEQSVAAAGNAGPGLSGAGASSFEPVQLLDLLRGPYRIADTGMSLRPSEVASGFRLWLAVHDERTVELSADDASPGADLVPSLRQGERFRSTVGLASDGALQLVSIDAESNGLVRLYGPWSSEPGLVERLRQWDGAGRPHDHQAQVLSYLSGAAPPPAEGTSLLRGRWSDLAVSWTR